MRLKDSKKATEEWATSDMPFFIMFAIALGLVLMFFLTMIGYFVSSDIYIPKDVDEFILVERLYNSPNCFAYKDEISGRVYLKSIDLNKFKNKDAISKCIPNIRFGLRIELESGTIKKETLTNPNWVENSDFKTVYRDVFIYYDNQIRSGKIAVSIQND